PPAVANLLSEAATTSKPVTACPALTRFAAMGRPMLPSPIKPMRAMLSSVNLAYAVFTGFLFSRFATFSFRPFARRHQSKANIAPPEARLHGNAQNPPTKDRRKRESPPRHRDRGREPAPPAPGSGKPQADRRDQIDDREEHGCCLPGQWIRLEPPARCISD